MRIIFIPGFAEDELIFSKIAPHLTGEKLILNSWTLLGDKPRVDFNVLVFAKEFIAKHLITDKDILIGHSMGGWIAYHVKHLVRCRIILIASMTNTNRIIPPVTNNQLIYSAIKKGLVFNKFTTWISSFGMYHHDYSKGIFLYYAEKLQSGNTENIINQLKTIVEPVNVTIEVQPDLRIHSKEDPILKPPTEPYYKVGGDHFTLYTHWEQVLVPLQEYFFNQLDK